MEKNAKDPDDALVKQALDGERQAFEVLLSHHYDRIYRLAFRYAAEESAARDITQEVALKLAKGLASFSFRSSFTTWLYRLTLNTCHDWARQKKPYAGDVDWQSQGDELTSDENPESKVYAKQIIQALQCLPEKLYETAVLVYAEGLSHKEAAVILHCAETTVSWRLMQVRRSLRGLEDIDLTQERKSDGRKDPETALAKS